MREKEEPQTAEQDHERLTNNEMHLKDDILFCQDMAEYIPNAYCNDWGCVYSSGCGILRRLQP